MRSFLVRCKDEKEMWHEPVEADMVQVMQDGTLAFHIAAGTGKKLSTVFSKSMWVYFVEVFKDAK